MSPGAVTALRCGIVAFYVVLASAMAGGDTTAAEVGVMFVVGGIALVGVLLAEWAWAVRPSDGDHDRL